ncbi:hypothetical protein [Botryobacter ruber]|uniref:hypothetical protein n=1 Tax=Botryobacter ruber TaxID=2171629 RepID=UPI000F64E18C|nr:hypothetical protein [Botryobacter ruber]
MGISVLLLRFKLRQRIVTLFKDYFSEKNLAAPATIALPAAEVNFEYWFIPLGEGGRGIDGFCCPIGI